jgi:transposase InsO family protein
MSAARRQAQRDHHQRRLAEQAARCCVAHACSAVRQHGVPVVQVTRCLGVSERTVRHWRREAGASPPACRGRRPRSALREDRNQVYRFLRERGAATPLVAVQAAFPHLRRADLHEVLRRYCRVQRRKAERHKSRLDWREPGTVWAADFKERREPIEGRYRWILSIKDLASRCQLVWQPLADATEAVVQATYARLFVEHGPPLVMKSDNGGPFRGEAVKQFLLESGVVPLFNPVRRPQYNGGVERANGQLAAFQEALAEFRGRPGLPTCDDAASARRLANESARPYGWRGPTAGELWAERAPIGADQRAAFQATVEAHRAQVRAQWNFAPDESLTHYQAAAVDRRAVRDALVEHDLLRIHPRRRSRAVPETESALAAMQPDPGAGRITLAQGNAAPTVGAEADTESQVATCIRASSEEAHYSTNKLLAGGKD